MKGKLQTIKPNAKASENCRIGEMHYEEGGGGVARGTGAITYSQSGWPNPARRLSQVSTLCGCNCGVKVKYFRQGLSLLRLDTLFASSCLRLFRPTIGERQAQKQRQKQKQKRKQLCQVFPHLFCYKKEITR